MAGPENFNPESLLEIAKTLDPNTLNALTNALGGVRQEFTQLGQGATTFGSQLDEVSKGINNSSGALQSLGKALNIQLPENIIKSIQVLAGNQMVAADNAIRLQKGFMDLAATTGSLGQVYDSFGSNLENVGGALNNQIDYLVATAKATGSGFDSAQKYYEQLGKIPKALSQVITTGDGSNTSINNLTAVMRLAHGTSRDTASIISDLSSQYDTLGLSGESALTFTARFSEISNKFGIQLESVKKGLVDATSAYKGYVDVGESAKRLTEGSASVMNNYMQALKETGMTGEQSAALLGSAFSSIKNMSDAQKSFLSSQMGGPGGLQGALKVDMMIREGKTEEVFENIRKDLTKRFGKIVSEKEAAESQEGAAQFFRQRAFLRQGPYGSIVGDDRQATRMLEAFKIKDEGGATPAQLSKDILSSTLEKGNLIENETKSVITEIRDLLREFQLRGNVGSLEMTRNFTALGESDLSKNLREGTIRSEASGTNAAQQNAEIYAGNKASPQKSSVLDMKDDFQSLIKDITGTGSQIVNNFKQEMMQIMGQKGGSEEIKSFMSEISKSEGERDNSKIVTFYDKLMKKHSENAQQSQVTVPTATGVTLYQDMTQKQTNQAIADYGRTPPPQAIAPKLDTGQRVVAQQMQQPILNAKLNVELNTKCSVCGHMLETSHTHTIDAISPAIGTLR